MVSKNQVIVMTSDNQYNILPAFYHLWQRYYHADYQMVICGFSPLIPPSNCEFYSIGKYEDYPPSKWSDALINVLDTVADDVFMLMLGDYLLTRPTDTQGVKMCYDYLRQFNYVLKMDLTSDRLNSDPGFYAYNNNTYDNLGYLDLIKSRPHSPYHMSLWGGLWRRDLLRKVLIPNETAQQIELNGTNRLSQYGDDILVLGTRQMPLKHANVIQSGKWNHDAMVGLASLRDEDRKELQELGYLE